MFGKIVRAATALIVLAFAPAAWSLPVPVDTANSSNGITDLFSATFDGALAPCTAADPTWCSFFSGKPGPNRNIVITPGPTGVVNAVPVGFTPVPVSGSYLDLTLNGPRTQLTIAGGTIAVAGISLTIQGGTPNSTVVNASSAGVVFSAAPQVAAVDANGRAEFLVNLAPAIAADFSTFSIIAAAPFGSCSGPLCAIIPVLTLDMVRYRLVVDYDENFETFTADFIGQTGNNSIVAITMNSAAPNSLVTLQLQAHNQISAGGAFSTLKWKTCAPTGSTNPCLSTTNAWTLANATGSTAAWTWNPATGVLAMTGTFQSTSFVSSNANGSPVISDKVVDLVINTTTDTTTAAAYNCIEGTFLASVGANGCLNVSLGDDFTNQSSALYNVGGGANCVQRTVGGDDVSTGNTRGLTNSAAAGPCNAVDGAFNFWVVERDDTASGGQLILRSDIPINSPGANFLTFSVAEDLVPDPFSFGTQAGVSLSTLVTSGAVTVSGIAGPTPVSVTGGQYSVGCGANYVSTASTINNGQSVCVRHTSAAVSATSTVTTLNIGGVTGTFTSITGTADTIPDAFTFVDQTGVAPDDVITSEPVTITGINALAPISVTGGVYSINGGAFTSAAGTVSNGNSVRVRHPSSGAPGTSVDTVLNVGGVTDTFTSTTAGYAVDDAATTPAGQPVVIDVLQNDNGLAPIVYVGIWINPVHGTASVTGAPGSPSAIRVTYAPNPGFSGADSFEYWVESGIAVDYGVVNVTVINADPDGDGVVSSLDNCTLVANADQCDSDGDGYGNRCDGDLTNNGFTNAQDTVVLRSKLGATSTAPTFNVADLNCNGFVNAQDTVLFRQMLGQPPGPSGLVP